MAGTEATKKGAIEKKEASSSRKKKSIIG